MQTEHHMARMSDAVETCRRGHAWTPENTLIVGADGQRYNAERFWSHVEKTDDCWLWKGNANALGYGSYAGRGGAHRIAYRMEVGAIPEGLELDHLCNNPPCVNPAHLEPVTREENWRRRRMRQTHCKHGHPYTAENTYLYGNTRICKTCHKKTQARYRDSHGTTRTVATREHVGAVWGTEHLLLHEAAS